MRRLPLSILAVVCGVSPAFAVEPEARASFAPVVEPTQPVTQSPTNFVPPPPPPEQSAPSWTPPEQRESPGAWQLPPQADRTRKSEDVSKRWMLSAEGVTHVPVDIGFQAGVELPFGGRLFAGYGWIPAAYLDVIIGAATAASEDTGSRAVISNTFDRGHAWRVQTGIRPFRKLGLYLDGGYSQVRLEGSLAAADIAAVAGVPESQVGGADYAVSSTIHMWLLELGYQALLADRLVLGIAAGVMGTIDANTEATPSFGGLGAEERLLRDLATEVVDQQIESYGFVPTLTLRLGVDLI